MTSSPSNTASNQPTESSELNETPKTNNRGGLTHLDSSGEAQMVDVSGKGQTVRRAIATGQVRMQATTMEAIQAGNTPKGDVLGTARLAGIMAAKKTSDLIPLCHPLALSRVSVEIEADEALPGLRVSCTARLTGQTGVEMEALTGARIAALTIYDMCKALSHDTRIINTQLVAKTGG